MDRSDSSKSVDGIIYTGTVSVCEMIHSYVQICLNTSLLLQIYTTLHILGFFMHSAVKI